MVLDLVALKRAFPRMTILAVDKPPLIGYTAFQVIRDGRSVWASELTFSLTVPRSAIKEVSPYGVMGEMFHTAEGRRKFITYIEDQAGKFVYRPTVWERLINDEPQLPNG